MGLHFHYSFVPLLRNKHSQKKNYNHLLRTDNDMVKISATALFAVVCILPEQSLP